MQFNVVEEAKNIFDKEILALEKTKNIYQDADGCAICCHKAHRG